MPGRIAYLDRLLGATPGTLAVAILRPLLRRKLVAGEYQPERDAAMSNH